MGVKKVQNKNTLCNINDGWKKYENETHWNRNMIIPLKVYFQK